MHSHSNKQSGTPPTFFPYFLASSCAAIFENILFHSLDTIAKRLQHHPVRVSATSPQFTTELLHVILPNITTTRGAFASLYQGLQTGIVYRIIQRNVMFAGQPRADYILNHHIGPTIEQQLGKAYRNPAVAAFAGLITCVIEMPFLMLDTAKVRMQTQGIGFKESILAGNLYNAAGITMTRNVIAATSLFGGAAFVRQLYGLDNPQQASLKQEWVASSFGATLATSLNNWADMLKTRLQASHGTKSAMQIGGTVWANEGIRGLFLRGLVPRLVTVAPRTAFTMTVVNQLVKKVNVLSEQGFFSRRKTLPDNINTLNLENAHENKSKIDSRC